MAELFFESKPFSDWRKSKESELKIQVSIINRINDVIRGLGIVAKVISGRR